MESSQIFLRAGSNHHLYFFSFLKKNYNDKIKCKLSKSKWTGLKLLVKQNTYDPFLLVQPVQLDQRNLTDENAELGVDYKYGLIDPVCSWQKKVVRQVQRLTEPNEVLRR